MRMTHVVLLSDTMYLEFVEHPRMAAIRSRTVWVHVDVPGQGQDAADLPTELVNFVFDITLDPNDVIPYFYTCAQNKS